MLEKLEKELMNIGGNLKKSTPNSIDQYIKAGIRLGQKKKRGLKVRIICNAAALMVIAAFLTTVRVSPVFAAYAARIPGLEYIVNLINYDKGIKAAVDNNFVEHINMSEEHEGLVFTIKDMIMDSSKAVIFYSIENKTNHRFVRLKEMRFTDEKGEPIKAGISWSTFAGNDMSEGKKLEDKVDMDFNEETVIPDKLYIEVTLNETDSMETSDSDGVQLAPVWKFKVPVDKKKLESMKKIYNLNQNIEVEGQKIFFRSVTVTPIRISVDVEYDKNNTKKILYFDDLAIYNEKGEKWATIANGISGSRKDEEHQTLYFESNYFSDAKELYLKGRSLRAVDKDKLEVLVDVEGKRLLKSPDNKLTLEDIESRDGSTSLEFSLVKDKTLDGKFSYCLFESSFEDSTGANLQSKESSFTGIADGSRQWDNFIISKDIKFRSPLKLTIQDYPARIAGDFKIRIK